MLTKEMITKQIPVLKPTDTGNYALSLMEDRKIKHLPVVNAGLYSFLLSEKDIFQMDNADREIAAVSLFAPCLRTGNYILDALHIFAKDHLEILPIIDNKGKYLGCITTSSLIAKMDEICNAGINGSIIALEINSLDYYLSNIVRLAESNNAKIQTVLTYPVTNTDKLNILLKIDLEDASGFLRSLERFNYQILYYFQKDGLVDEVLKKRLDELMYYLKM